MAVSRYAAAFSSVCTQALNIDRCWGPL